VSDLRSIHDPDSTRYPERIFHAGRWMTPEQIEEKRERDRRWKERQRRARGQRTHEQYVAERLVDEPGYAAVHLRVQKPNRGKPCANCGTSEGITQALRHDGSPSARRVERGRGSYSIQVEDYVPLCWSCHALYDGASERRRRDNLARRRTTSCLDTRQGVPTLRPTTKSAREVGQPPGA